MNVGTTKHLLRGLEMIQALSSELAAVGAPEGCSLCSLLALGVPQKPGMWH